jgi:hypothetical protein
VLDHATPSSIDTIGDHTIPSELLIRIDNGDVKTFDAEFMVWNAHNVAVVAEGRTPELIAVIRAIGGGKKSISEQNLLATG